MIFRNQSSKRFKRCSCLALLLLCITLNLTATTGTRTRCSDSNCRCSYHNLSSKAKESLDFTISIYFKGANVLTFQCFNFPCHSSELKVTATVYGWRGDKIRVCFPTESIFHPLISNTNEVRAETQPQTSAKALYQRMKSLGDFRFDKGMSVGEEEIVTLQKWSQIAAKQCAECYQSEIGVLWGASSVSIATSLKENSPNIQLIAMDPNTGGEANYKATMQNFIALGVDDIIQYHEDFPVNVTISRPLSLLFMDGGHNYQRNSEFWDYTIYSAHYNHFEHLLIDGAIIIVDDAGCPLHSTMRKFTENLVAAGRAVHVENGPVDSAQCYQIVLQKLSRFPALSVQQDWSVRVSGTSKVSHLLDFDNVAKVMKFSKYNSLHQSTQVLFQ